MAPRILVVDDEKAITETLYLIFRSAGYLVASASSGDEAIDQAEIFRPDLLLSDIMMPGMNGFEAGLRIKEICPECHLLFFSGQAATARLAQRFVQTFTDRGYVFELLPKPLHPVELLRKVENALLRVA